MMKRLTLILILALLWVNILPLTVLAHGVEFKYESNSSYLITGFFDDGSPLSAAQVTIYAPDDPKKPWGTGISDEQGQYLLTPDLTKPGIWTVQFRKAGHGGTINLDIGGQMGSSSSTAYSTTQIVLMVIAVLWGFVGTALYFKRERR